MEILIQCNSIKYMYKITTNLQQNKLWLNSLEKYLLTRTMAVTWTPVAQSQTEHCSDESQSGFHRWPQPSTSDKRTKNTSRSGSKSVFKVQLQKQCACAHIMSMRSKLSQCTVHVRVRNWKRSKSIISKATSSRIYNTQPHLLRAEVEA